jgi:hypothetical protein
MSTLPTVDTSARIRTRVDIALEACKAAPRPGAKPNRSAVPIVLEAPIRKGPPRRDQAKTAIVNGF